MSIYVDGAFDFDLVAMEYRGKNMVFLVGCPRSGTTWLQKLLASHPRIRSGEESHFFSLYVGPQLRSWNDQKTRHLDGRLGHAAGPQAYFREEEFRAILKNYLAALLKPIVDGLEPEELFLEKTPSHALYIPNQRAAPRQPNHSFDARLSRRGRFAHDRFPELGYELGARQRESGRGHVGPACRSSQGRSKRAIV